MKYAKNNRKTSRRRYKRKGKKVYRKNRRVAPSWFPFGNSRTCRLRYSEQVTIDPVVSSVGTYTFSANGLYDPNISGTGHQPYGFDQLMALYNQYVVTGARIRVFCITGAVASYNNSIAVGVKLSDSSSLNTGTPYELFEQPGLRMKMINNNSVGTPAVSCNFSAKKFFRIRGGKNQLITADEFHGNSGSNPSNGAFFIVNYSPLVSGTDLPSTTFQIVIDYVATFMGPKELTSS